MRKFSHIANFRKKNWKKLHKYEENLQELKERLRELENILEKKSDELAEIRKEYSKQLSRRLFRD